MELQHPAERRVSKALGDPEITHRLAGLPGADLTSFLLAVMRERAQHVRAPELLRQYRDRRFVMASVVPLRALKHVEDAFLSQLPDMWEAVTLSPLAPFATHAATGGVSQDWVVSTVRGNEVAADPTNVLALEAALRRRTDRARRLRLATIQRVIRGQSYRQTGPSHFSLFALVTAGRDSGGHEFEASALAEQVVIHAAGVKAAGGRHVRVVLTDWTDGDRESVLGHVEQTVARLDDVAVARDANRAEGRAYYQDVAFKIRASHGDDDFEVTDGGFTRWTSLLLSDRRERICISGSGLDRLARM